MKIGVLSDTHLPTTAKSLSAKVLNLLAATDAIIHAGDFQDAALIEVLQQLGDFYGVCGNMDASAIRARLPEKRVLQLGGFSIGIIHGRGAPNGLEERILQEFAGEKPDAIVYGHSHLPANHLKNGILLFNPGSPTDRRHAPFPSIGILTLSDTLTGEIVKV